MTREGCLPWRRLLETSYGVLHLAPDIFWSMTPPEWMAAMTGSAAGYEPRHVSEAAAMTHDDLQALRQRFPDMPAAATASAEDAARAF